MNRLYTIFLKKDDFSFNPAAYDKLKSTIDEFENALENRSDYPLDLSKVHAFMEMTNWTWNDNMQVPTIEDLKNTLSQLVYESVSNALDNIVTDNGESSLKALAAKYDDIAAASPEKLYSKYTISTGGFIVEAAIDLVDAEYTEINVHFDILNYTC